VCLLPASGLPCLGLPCLGLPSAASLAVFACLSRGVAMPPEGCTPANKNNSSGIVDAGKQTTEPSYVCKYIPTLNAGVFHDKVRGMK